MYLEEHDNLHLANATSIISLLLAPQIQRGFPVYIVRNTNLVTYLLTYN